MADSQIHITTVMEHNAATILAALIRESFFYRGSFQVSDNQPAVKLAADLAYALHKELHKHER